MKINDRDLVWFTPTWKKLYEYAKETGKPKPRKWEKKLSKLYGGKVMTYAELRQSFFEYYSNRPTVNAEPKSVMVTISKSLNQWKNAGLIKVVE